MACECKDKKCAPCECIEKDCCCKKEAALATYSSKTMSYQTKMATAEGGT